MHDCPVTTRTIEKMVHWIHADWYFKFISKREKKEGGQYLLSTSQKMEEDVIKESLQTLETRVDTEIFGRDALLQSLSDSMASLASEEKELSGMYQLYIKRLHGGNWLTADTFYGAPFVIVLMTASLHPSLPPSLASHYIAKR
jgi:hypothetical protein